MWHGGRTLAIVGWVLGWTVLLAVGLGQAAEHYQIAPQKSQLQFKGYSLLANALGTFHRFSGEIVADAQQLAHDRGEVRIHVADHELADRQPAPRNSRRQSKDSMDDARPPK